MSTQVPNSNSVAGISLKGTPTDGQVLRYNATENILEWVDETVINNASIRYTKTANTTLTDDTTFQEIVFSQEDFNTNPELFELDVNGRIKCLFTGEVAFAIQASMLQTNVSIGVINSITTHLMIDGLTVIFMETASTAPDIINSKTAGMYSGIQKVNENEALSFRVLRSGVAGNSYQNSFTNGFKLSLVRI